MIQKGDELIVINKKVFVIILSSIAILGIIVGYLIGYFTVPAKQIYIQKNDSSERTVLPSTVETAYATKQDPQASQIEQKQEKTQPPQQEQNKKQTPQSQIKDEQIMQKQLAQSKTDTITAKEEKVQVKKDEQAAKPLKESSKVESAKTEEKPKIKSKPKKITKTATSKSSEKQPYFTIQVGAFSDLEKANKMNDKIIQQGYKSFITKEENLFKVRVGRYKTFQEAKLISSELNEKGFENFILKLSKEPKRR